MKDRAPDPARLTHRQWMVVEHLAAGRRIDRVASDMNLDPDVVRRIARNPRVRRALQIRRLDQASSRISLLDYLALAAGVEPSRDEPPGD